MKLVVGLGNPGNEYHETRHNIGFMLLDYILLDDFKLNKKLNAMEYVMTINGEKVVFIKPLSYMNLSGLVVRSYMQFYKIDVSDIFVIQDDLDMDVGKYKIMVNHGDGGHNGIKDIIKNVGSREFIRLKIGISKNKMCETKDYVLGKFSKEERECLNDSFVKLKDIFNDYVMLGRNEFIQKYNTRN